MNPIYLLAAGAAAVFLYLQTRGTEETPEPDEETPDGLTGSAVTGGKLLLSGSTWTPPSGKPSGLAGGGGGTSGNPPNVSGLVEPNSGKGYNYLKFDSPRAVRSSLRFLGYYAPDVNAAPPSGEVLQFQKHYNKAALDGYKGASGALLVDGIPGEYTLRALEIAASGLDGWGPDDIIRGVDWQLFHGFGAGA